MGRKPNSTTVPEHLFIVVYVGNNPATMRHQYPAVYHNSDPLMLWDIEVDNWVPSVYRTLDCLEKETQLSRQWMIYKFGLGSNAREHLMMVDRYRRLMTTQSWRRFENGP